MLSSKGVKVYKGSLDKVRRLNKMLSKAGKDLKVNKLS